MEKLKILRILLIFNLWVMASSQPIESIATNGGGSTLSAMLLNLGQAFLELFQWKWFESLFHTSIPIQPLESNHNKILIATGFPGEYPGEYSSKIGLKTRIIDPKNPDFVCDNFPDYPLDYPPGYGVGGVVEGNVPLICGGIGGLEFRDVRQCFMLKNRQWKESGSMEYGTSNMGVGNVVINQKLLLSGGSFSPAPEFSRSSVLKDVSSSESIEDLPIGISGHCMTMLNATHYMVTGGSVFNGKKIPWNTGVTEWTMDKSSKTFIFDLTSQLWSDGPSMLEPRTSHGCVHMMLGDKPIIWVTGGNGDDSHLRSGYNHLQTTEYLDLDNLGQGWKSGLCFSVRLNRISYIIGFQVLIYPTT